MSKQTFDAVTRNIRTAETEARKVIASADSVINGARRVRKVTVDSYRPVFDNIGAALQATNQLHDVVVAHSHLVAENIARRSITSVLAIRESLLETANRMLELCGKVSIPETVYNPQNAFDKIANALSKDGLLTDEPKTTEVMLSSSQAMYLTTYHLEQMVISIVVSIEVPPNYKLGDTAETITVSVWKDRLPPIWDTSYHDAAGVMIPVGSPKGKNLGGKTKQTDNALIDHVASTLAREVVIRNDSTSPIVRDTPMRKTNRYSTYVGSAPKRGSSKFDYQQRASILQSAITGMSVDAQHHTVITLNPDVVNKASLARYILSIIMSYSETKEDLAGFVAFNREGYYEIKFPSSGLLGGKVRELLEGKL